MADYAPDESLGFSAMGFVSNMCIISAVLYILTSFVGGTVESFKTSTPGYVATNITKGVSLIVITLLCSGDVMEVLTQSLSDGPLEPCVFENVVRPAALLYGSLDLVSFVTNDDMKRQTVLHHVIVVLATAFVVIFPHLSDTLLFKGTTLFAVWSCVAGPINIILAWTRLCIHDPRVVDCTKACRVSAFFYSTQVVVNVLFQCALITLWCYRRAVHSADWTPASFLLDVTQLLVLAAALFTWIKDDLAIMRFLVKFKRDFHQYPRSRGTSVEKDVIV
jgi:hypothetical protein